MGHLALLTAQVVVIALTSTTTAYALFVPPEGFDLFTTSATIISGFCGGLIRMLHDQTRIWPRGLVTMISGGVVALFLWPVGQPFIEMMTGRLALEPLQKVMLGGFVIGLIGMGFIGAILDFAKLRRDQLKGKPDDQH